jgi:hypothetical protein
MSASDAPPPPAPAHPRIRRVLGALLTTLIALGGVVLLIVIFEGRDASPLHRSGDTSPGQAIPDGGRGLVRDGAVRFDGVRLDAAALLDLLERGNVVLLYGSAQPPAAVERMADRVAGPFDPALADGGQAIVLARKAGTDGVVALAWQHVLRTQDPADPALEAFASDRLGRGAP